MAQPTEMGAELGVGAPAIYVALAPQHRIGLVEWDRRSLRLTEAGKRVARRIRLASDLLWLDIEEIRGCRVEIGCSDAAIHPGRGLSGERAPVAWRAWPG